MLIGLVSLLTANLAFACSELNNTYKLNNSDIKVLTKSGKAKVNNKASKALGETIYITVNSTSTVMVDECSNYKVKIHVVEPEWLSDSHVGWIDKKYLRLAGKEFIEADFSFYKDSLPYKEVIIEGVNKIAKENKRCKVVDPSSANRSVNKSKPGKPVFYVTCEDKKGNPFNVLFSEAETKGSLAAKQHINKVDAIQLCEDYVKSVANYPSTVDFSRFIDVQEIQYPNGRSRIKSTFTAKNSFNLEAKSKVSCLFNGNGFIEAQITK